MVSSTFKLCVVLASKCRIGLCMAGMMLLHSQIVYAACPEIPVPQNLHAQSIGQNIEMNGMLLVISRAETLLSALEIQQFYNMRWNKSQDSNDYIEYEMEPWHVIAHQQANCMMTIQTKALGTKTEVLLAVGTKVAISNKAGANFPMMAGSAKLSDMKSNDQGKAGRMLVFNNPYTATGNADFYNAKLQDLGWVKLFQSTPVAHDQQSIVMSFRRGAEWAEITLNYGNGKTTVVANLNE